MELNFERVYKIVHELEDKVQREQEIEIQTYVDQMEEAFEELCSQILLPFMRDSLKELYEGDMELMRSDVEKVQCSEKEVLENTRQRTVRVMLQIFRELTGETY